MFAAGTSQAEVARALGVSRQSVSCWYAAYRQAVGGVARRERAGRKPRLTKRQLGRIEAALREGPAAQGFPTIFGPCRASRW